VKRRDFIALLGGVATYEGYVRPTKLRQRYADRVKEAFKSYQDFAAKVQ